jgi:hypothetical protein
LAIPQLLNRRCEIKLYRTLFKIAKCKYPMEGAKDEQDWNHKGARLLENREPSFVEVLRDAATDIEESIVIFLNLFLKHARDNVIRLIKEELKLLAEEQEA